MKKIGQLKLHRSADIGRSFVSIGFECLDRDMFKAEKCYDTIGGTGVKHARVQTGWVKCETQKGVYDFSWLDDIVGNLLSRGVEPWFNVTYGNPIYMSDISNPTAVGCMPMCYGSEVMKAWINYVTKLAEHYKGKVSVFEIWNEPDIPQFWYPGKPDPAVYAEFVQMTCDAIRKAIPECKIGGCVSARNWDYIGAFFSKTKAGTIDFFCIHMYMAVPESNYRESVSYAKSIMKKYGHENCELWQGEAGYPSWFPEKHFYPHTKQSSEHQQAVWMLRRFFLDASENLGMSSYFQMADMWEKAYDKANETLKKPAAQGIVNGITYTPKKSCEVISRIATVFSGDVRPFECYLAGDHTDSYKEKYGRMLFSFIRGNSPFFAYYVPYCIQDEVCVKKGFWLDISKPAQWEKADGYVLIDMYTGDVFEISPSAETDKMISFSHLPFADYPMIVCSRTAFETE